MTYLPIIDNVYFVIRPGTHNFMVTTTYIH